MTQNVLNFAKKKHFGQKRIGGEDYITHPIAVAEILKNKGLTHKDFINTALLHDVLEDTNATEQEILTLTNHTVLTAIKLLTKEKGYNNDSYLKAIEENELTKFVKLADRIHNLQSAIIAYPSFKQKYIEETELYYLDLAKNTIFESDMKQCLKEIKESLLN